MFSFIFFANSILLGIGLAMDAFSVSLTNGLNEPKMKFGRMSLIAGCYGFFQIAMPLIGWVCVHNLANAFSAFQRLIPWIAFLLLLYIGGKMLIESIQELKAKNEDGDSQKKGELSFGTLVLQGVATSIDALSVGFTIADYNWIMALVATFIIGIVTFGICIVGLTIGKKVGNKLGPKAGILGGVILIGIGIEILLKGLLG